MVRVALAEINGVECTNLAVVQWSEVHQFVRKCKDRLGSMMNIETVFEVTDDAVQGLSLIHI